MAQLFRPRANSLARAAILVLVFGVVGGFAVLASTNQPWYIKDTGKVRDQPVPFSHAHHVGDLGINCRFCHASVDTSTNAGFPSTKVCMTCHSQLWTNAELLKPVRDSYHENKPLVWHRVYQLPEYVYFDHSIHIARGIACQECHGRVDKMPLLSQANPMSMGFCIRCHRGPEEHLGPPSQVYTMRDNFESVLKQRKNDGINLAAKYHVQLNQLTDCYICHR